MHRTLTLSLFLLFTGISLVAQTNPTPQTLPYNQNFGTSAFTALPAGWAAWNGISGLATSTQALAEASAATGNQALGAGTGLQTQGGIYCYVDGTNPKLYVQTSGNATYGVTQPALAISTSGVSGVKISYKLSIISGYGRTVGVVLQYRVGTTDTWTTIPASVDSLNTTIKSVGVEYPYTDLQLPAAADNQPVVQLRWALWRSNNTGGSSCGIGLDDVSIYAGQSTSVPAAPVLSSPANGAAGQPLAPTLSWSASSGAETYRLQLAYDQAFTRIVVDSANISGTSLTVSGLFADSVYYWRVNAKNANGTSAYSTVRNFATISNKPPQTPLLLTPSNQSVNTPAALTCTWNAATGAVTYQFQLATDSSFATPLINDSTLTTTSRQVSGLNILTTYYWRVRSKNTVAASAYTSAWRFTTASATAVPQQILFTGQTGQTLLTSIASNYTTSSVLGYDGARDKLYGEIDKVGDTLKCVYTGFACYMPPGTAPRTAAGNGGINAEHTFPQSLGAGSGNAESDMHHLYPSKDNVNSTRGNLPFAEIPDAQVTTWYRLTESTSSKPSLNAGDYSKYSSSLDVFEPRNWHKGHVARTIFYFYTIYKSQSSASFFEGMKTTLLKWHSQFPIDSVEYARTIKIAAYQGGKANPFILDSTLVRRAYAPASGVQQEDTRVPSGYELRQNYPNPFNPSTTLSFTLPSSGFVTLKVYDIMGREVSALTGGIYPPGTFSVTFNAAQLPSGMYFATLRAGTVTLSRKMILAK